MTGDLDKRVRRKVAAITGRPLRQRLRAACIEQGIDYDVAPGVRQPIDLMAAPVTLSRVQLSFLHRLSEAINHYVRRMPSIYAKDEVVQSVLPFPEAQARWIRACSTDAPQTI